MQIQQRNQLAFKRTAPKKLGESFFPLFYFPPLLMSSISFSCGFSLLAWLMVRFVPYFVSRLHVLRLDGTKLNEEKNLCSSKSSSLDFWFTERHGTITAFCYALKCVFMVNKKQSFKFLMKNSLIKKSTLHYVQIIKICKKRMSNGLVCKWHCRKTKQFCLFKTIDQIYSEFHQILINLKKLFILNNHWVSSFMKESKIAK